MRINYNVSAMLANNTLTNSDNALSKSIQRLSSGLKINYAKDNPAGLAMAKRMNGQIAGTGIAKQNSNDGISVIETADGAMSEIHDMLHRMTELATKAANGVNTEDDRRIIQLEIDELKKEVQRISKATQFNGQNLLDGTFDYKGYSSVQTTVTPVPAPEVRVSTINSEVDPGKYSITSLSWAASTDGSGKIDVTAFTMTVGEGANAVNKTMSDYNISMVDNYVTLTDETGFEMTLEIQEDLVFSDPTTNLPVSGSIGQTVDITCTNIGPMRLQSGSNEGHIIAVEIPALSLGNLGISRLDVTTEQSASYAIERLKGANQFVSSVRGKLGAYQNRLESAVDNLGVVEENMTSAYSRMMDVDMAEEMTAYSTHNVIVQAGTSVLAQANERPSMVLQLLQ
ncbi:MAG: flagellin FliC3 [Lachnospiraceae bacterium]|nr:flagellin FliC3 [Lachnospiraceae bacterium]